MSYAVTQALRDAVTGNAEFVTLVSVLRGGVEVATNLPIADGTASATVADRDAKFTVSSQETDAGLLDPRSDVVVVWLGVRGVQLVPMFTGRVDTVGRTIGVGKVAVSCVSRAVELQRNAFEAPYGIIGGNTVAYELNRMVAQTDATFTVDTSQAAAATAALTPKLAYDQNPLQAAQDLASSVNCTFSPDRVGGFTVAPSQFGTGVALAPVVTLRDDANPQQISTIDVASSRAKSYNSVTVLVEQMGGTLPISATARDTDPSSATYYGGLFGRQSTTVRTSAPLDRSAATALAQRLLRSARLVLRSWQLTVPFLPYVDPGDVISVYTEGQWTMQLVESVGWSLRTGATTLSTQEIAQV